MLFFIIYIFHIKKEQKNGAEIDAFDAREYSFFHFYFHFFHFCFHFFHFSNLFGRQKRHFLPSFYNLYIIQIFLFYLYLLDIKELKSRAEIDAFDAR